MLTPQDVRIVQGLRRVAAIYAARAAAGIGFAVGKAAVCTDIADRVSRSNRFASERQRSYAEALIRWIDEPSSSRRAPAQAAVAEARSDEREMLMSTMTLARIAQLFAAAAGHALAQPKIRLQRGEWKIRIYPAPAFSRNAGLAYYVKAKSGTGRDLYCGMIRVQSGEFVPYFDAPLDVLQALREFNADPRSVATAYGRATGACCFCGRLLTDGRSVAMGYGPICAEHYGLEWGEQRARSVVNVDAAAPEGDQTMIPRTRDLVELQHRMARSLEVQSEFMTGSTRIRPSFPDRNAESHDTSRERVVPTDEDEDSHFM